MQPTPPDLGRPYGSARERDADAENLIDYWYALEALLALSATSPDRWSPIQAALAGEFSPADGERLLTQDAQATRLKRWASLFQGELGLIRDVRNQLVRGGIVTDPELLGAAWLARQVLATVAGVAPGEVDRAWARRVAARASP